MCEFVRHKNFVVNLHAIRSDIPLKHDNKIKALNVVRLSSEKVSCVCRSGKFMG